MTACETSGPASSGSMARFHYSSGCCSSLVNAKPETRPLMQIDKGEYDKPRRGNCARTSHHTQSYERRQRSMIRYRSYPVKRTQ